MGEAKQTVLVVEDDKGIRDMLYDALADTGYNVIPVETVPTGILAFDQDDSIDAVVTDLDTETPLNGIDLIKHIRQATPCTPVLMLSAYKHEEDKGRALQAGANYALEKPPEILKILSLLEVELASTEIKKPIKRIIDDYLSATMTPRQQAGYEARLTESCAAAGLVPGPFIAYFRNKITLEEEPAHQRLSLL